jgi:hypothetical protein
MLARLRKQFIGFANYSVLISMYHPSYLCNISRCFMLLVNSFSLISNEVLISLHRCLDSIHINCPTAMRGVFNYILYGYSCILYALIIKIIIGS